MKYLNVVLFFVFAVSVSCVNVNDTKPLLNSAHLDYLYEEVDINGREMAFIHIYSNYPDYEYIDDDDEGTACVDDAARAAIFYLNHFIAYQDEESLIKNKKLLEFILYLQSDNGFFYNFMWKDHTINRDFKTSVASANWWSWRALWVLTESYPYYKKSDDVFAERIWSSVEELVIEVKKQIPAELETESYDGMDIPAWLPAKYASDQASVLILGLLNYYTHTNEKQIFDYIKILCEGIMQMQLQDINNKYYGAFLSWQNTWHAWGNSQAYALLKSYALLKDNQMLKAALTELDNFMPALQSNQFLNSFSISKTDGMEIIENESKYSQIAYNIRPMVFALLEAYSITGKEKYAELSGTIARWLTGNNSARTTIYNEKTGIVFDGIESEQKVNMNSGAESTIEALLTILKIKTNNNALKAFNKE